MNTEKQDYEIAREELTAFWDSIGLKAEVRGPTPYADEDWCAGEFVMRIADEEFVWRAGVAHFAPSENREAVLKSAEQNLWRYKLSDSSVPFLRMLRLGGGMPKSREVKLDLARVACAVWDKSKIQELAPEIAASYADDAMSARDWSFEEWAGEFGYDRDSRKAEGIYRQCLEGFHKLRKAGLNQAQIEKLAELRRRL